MQTGCTLCTPVCTFLPQHTHAYENDIQTIRAFLPVCRNGFRPSSCSGDDNDNLKIR